MERQIWMTSTEIMVARLLHRRMFNVDRLFVMVIYISNAFSD